MLESLWASPRWKAVERIADRLLSSQLSLFAAGIAFFGLLAVFPALTAFAALYGIFADTGMVYTTLSPLRGIVPPAAYDILGNQLIALSMREEATLGFGAVMAFLLSIWSAASGIKSLMAALNYDYVVKENRGFFHRTGIALGFTVGGLIMLMVVLALIVGLPAALELARVDKETIEAVVWVPWLAIAAIVVLALTVIYRYGPSRLVRQFRYEIPGAVVATTLWVFASVGFSIYVANFGDYNKTFGSLGAVVVLLMWFYLSAYAICIGAEINAELKRRAEARGQP